jgi:hypothetical protein
MPTEVQFMIAKLVDKKDLLTPNSTCRALSSLVQPVMASTFGSDRTFDFSDDGMTALLALSERTTWAPYLKTLIIAHNGTTKPTGCHQILAAALKNFGAFKNLTSLGIRQGGYQGYFEHHKPRAYVYIRGFLENMLASAMAAGLPIRNVIFDIGISRDVQDHDVQRRAWVYPSLAQEWFVFEVNEVFAIMDAVYTMSFPHVNRSFRFPKMGFEGTGQSPIVTYDPRKHSLVAKHLMIDDWKLVLRWFRGATTFEIVELLDCNVEVRAFHEMIISQSLRTLIIKDVTLSCDRAMSGLWHFSSVNAFLNIVPLPLWFQGWESVFHGLIVHSPNLSSCLLGQLGFHERTFTGATWGADSVEDVRQLLQDLERGKRSRLDYKKESATSTDKSRKSVKKAPRKQKLRFSNKKSSQKKT